MLFLKINYVLYSKSAVYVQGDHCYHQSSIHIEQYLPLLKRHLRPRCLALERHHSSRFTNATSVWHLVDHPFAIGNDLASPTANGWTWYKMTVVTYHQQIFGRMYVRSLLTGVYCNAWSKACRHSSRGIHNDDCDGCTDNILQFTVLWSEHDTAGMSSLLQSE